ncbi:jerky protein homolog-like [Mercenaria mercenaria]|uniref:jerky protein homolog-like n=1 Tax=Mercenaria mercenaria TaxID=6596 RepID=UPI00234F40EE|nr:jerky protein homolog-like [Mercenaria mercenaria]
MPKKYVYTKRGKTQNYREWDLEKAVKAVQDNSMSIRKASTMYGVSKSTIGDRISGKHELHVPNGRPPHIPRDVERKIVDAVKMAARRGIGLTRKQVLARTNVLCRRMKIGSGYTNFTAGKDWWEGVKRRHPDVVIRKPEKLTSTRARMMNREVINSYFNDLGTIVEGLNLEGNPRVIWNCDEMGKNFEHDPVRVVAEKGEKNCLSRTSSKSTNITVMTCVNASGRRMPPMFVVKGKTSRSLYGFNTSAAPIGTRWAWQKNGWMDDNLGERWFNEVFLEFCGSERPQLLILDGHSSHETLGILMRAMEENIHILALPPHTTHAL